MTTNAPHIYSKMGIDEPPGRKLHTQVTICWAMWTRRANNTLAPEVSPTGLRAGY
uniref:Uncharacterized protein n=1 Tax=Pyricularia oryzae (strain 70-15 / ATCC MYA-4617 / FGSC 8958) TaxID=242507 RepID=Q2KG32_PYRO7|nr:hypothetical protein MGCH7_ch7g503 [Pyricularia oryzae 70-15]